MGKFGLKNWSSANSLKFGTGIHCYILNSNVYFSNIFVTQFFGQIWSQTLKFSKLTEIRYKGTLLYTYDFRVNFSKIFITHAFWANWLKFGTVVDCYMLILILMFIFSYFLSLFFWGKFGPIIWRSTKWLKFHRGVHCCMLITISMFIFPIFCQSSFFLANLVSKSEVLQIDRIFIEGYITICLLQF